MSRCVELSVVFIVIAASVGCSSGQRRHLETVTDYRAARQAGDLDRAQSLLAPDARIWFDDFSGDGAPIDLRTGWNAWDREMDAVVTPLVLENIGEAVVGHFHEVNDFSRLLGFDGWWSHMTYWFDDAGRIEKQLYEAMEDRPSGQAEAFAPFREWAEANRPDEFAAIDPIEPGTATARRWRMLLIDWRRATGQPMPRMPGWEARLKERVRTFVLAGTWEQYVGQTSPDFRFWLEEKVGAGLSRAELRDMFEWSQAMHSRPEVQRIEVEGDDVHAFIHEENDFTRLINFGGFNTNVIFRVDGDGRIREQVVIDQGTMPAFREALQAPLDWLAANRADELAFVAPNGEMVFNGAMAENWLTLLRDWRRATGQPPVD